MTHRTVSRFRQCFEALPKEIQEAAEKNYELLKENPSHASLHFKRVGKYWSVRVSRDYRALAVEIEDGFLWFWIGKHSEYDKLIAQS